MLTAFAVAACSAGSSGDTGSLSTAQSTPSTSAEVDAAVAGKTLTSGPASPTPTMVLLSDEQLARAVYARFLESIAIVGDPPNPNHPMIAATTTGVLYDRYVAALVESAEFGQRSVGGYKSSIVSVQMAGDRATILDCALDESVGFEPTGEPGAADTEWRLRSARVERTTAGWRVADFVRGDPCVPAT